MIVVLRDDDMGQQSRPGAAAGNRVIWRGRRDDDVAGPAGELLADMLDHLEPARHVIECLGDILADPAQRAAAGGTGMRRLMQNALAPAGALATGGGPAFALRWPPRSPLPSPARPQRSSRLGRLPASRSPTRVGPPRAPAAPTSGRTRHAGSGPVGSAAWQSGPPRRP